MLCITIIISFAGCSKNDDSKTFEASENNLFEKLPQGFDFSSGAGGWGTHIDLNPDGTFTGQYYDSDMGDTGSGYSNGTVYICNFDGKFSTPKQVNDFVYSMKFDNADEFMIYLPGIAISDLPEGFTNWLYAFINVQTTEILPYCGIYNVSGGGRFRCLWYQYE